MPEYAYHCNTCGKDEIKDDADYFVLMVEHRISLCDDIKVACPFCKGTNTERLIQPPAVVYIRGYGWLDKKGAHRDMNKWKLVNEDPYAGMREPGEAGDLAERFDKKGKFNEGRAASMVKLKEDFKKENEMRKRTGVASFAKAEGKWDEDKHEIVWAYLD